MEKERLIQEQTLGAHWKHIPKQETSPVIAGVKVQKLKAGLTSVRKDQKKRTGCADVRR